MAKKIKKYKFRTFWENRCAWLIILIFTALFLIFEFVSYYNFRFPVLDLGLYNRHFWGMSNFDFGANPLKGYNLLGDHSHFVLLILIPIYSLFKHPQTLLVIQALAVALSGYPIYLIAKKYFGNKTIASLWLIPYFLYFGFASALDYPFHVSVLAVLPMAWAFYFLLEKKTSPLLISLAFLLLTKEDMPLIVIFFGLYLMFFYRKYLLGSIIVILSAIYFVYITKYFLPNMSQIHYYYSDAGQLGQTWSEAIVNSIKQPLLFFKNLFTPIVKTTSMIYSILPFAGLSLLAPEIFVFISPLWLGRFLNTQEWRWLTLQHYSANQTPILIVAAIIGLYRLSKLFKNKRSKDISVKIAITAMFVATIYVNYQLPGRDLFNLFDKGFYIVNPEVMSAREAIKLIPNNASVGVQSAFPQLTSRDKVYNVPKFIDSGEIWPEYVVLSTTLDFWPFKSAEEVQSFKENLILNRSYQEVFNENGVFVVKRTNVPSPK
ncbi:MAG: hypothetical protein BWY19_00474 [bacterium ADurb.Bin212]|nr:MAG: hypothetical protein BWY19_00474 [bacterium ADurb.Bin212]